MAAAHEYNIYYNIINVVINITTITTFVRLQSYYIIISVCPYNNIIEYFDEVYLCSFLLFVL